MRGRLAFKPAGNRNEIGVQARRDKASAEPCEASFTKNFQNLNINQS
jgi:hypothetical protein